MSMRSFQHLAAPLRLFHGADSLVQIGRELDRLKCKRAVIFCGATLSRQAALIDQVKAALGERCAGLYAGVRAHSPVPAVEEAARSLRELGADAVVAIGGGSAIVTARAASILLAENGSAQDLCTAMRADGTLTSPKLLAAKLPQLIIPTTPTTATVKAGSAVFDPVSGKRLALFDPKTRAHALFIHPDFIGSAPDGLLLSSGLNTLTLAIEGLVSRTGDPLADALLMHAVRLLAKHLPASSTHADANVRGEMMLAAVMCGQGTDFSGAGITTVLGHAIGARFNVENGLANAVVLPHGMRFNADAAPVGMSKVAAALGLAGTSVTLPASRIIDALTLLLSPLNIPRRLRDLGIANDALPEIASHAMGDWFLRGNPRAVSSAAELQGVLRAAW